MYGALWRVLPGPIWAKILILVALVVLVLFVFVEWVFPWADALLNTNNQGTVAT
jgi:lipopolysaccharide export LptBFGC system permease protein LptF